MNLPNRLTILRVLLIPVFIFSLFLPSLFGASQDLTAWLSSCIFIIAGITDTLDGKIARKRNLITDFGKFMDPIADKLLTCSAMIMLTYLNRLHPVFTIIFIAREFIISGFRLIAAGKGVVIAADKLGKIKTVLQIIFIVALLLAPALPFRVLQPFYGYFCLGLVIVTIFISIFSCIQYITKNKGVIDFHDC